MKFLFTCIFVLLSLPGFAQEDDNKLLNDLEKAQQERLEKAAAAQEKKSEPVKQVDFQITPGTLTNKKKVLELQKILKDSPVQKLSHAEVEKMIIANSSDSFIGEYLEESPKLLAFFADILRDKNALSSAIGIFLRKGDLLLYSIIWFIFVWESWIIKQLVIAPQWPRSTRILTSLMISVILTGASLFAFYMIFTDELSPTVNIIFDHWNKA